MAEFQIHTTETASDEAQEVLQRTKAKYGRIPNLIGGLAEAPIAAEAYLSLSDLVGRSSFTPTERHVVWFTINAYHDCTYCMAAHTAIAAAEKIDSDVVDTARAVGHYDDPHLEALRKFTLQMTENRGWVDPSDVDQFLAAGFTRQQVLEIVTFIAHKVMSNYSNHLLQTPLDAAFKPNAWSKPASTVA